MEEVIVEAFETEDREVLMDEIMNRLWTGYPKACVFLCE